MRINPRSYTFDENEREILLDALRQYAAARRRTFNRYKPDPKNPRSMELDCMVLEREAAALDLVAKLQELRS